MMLLQHKEHQMASKPPDTRAEAWSRFSLTGLEETNPANTLSQTTGLQNCETINISLIHPFCGTLLQQLWQTNTDSFQMVPDGSFPFLSWK